MKASNKKRIERLEKLVNTKEGKSTFAMVIHDSEIVNFDLEALDIKCDVVFVLPDNGRRMIGDEIPKGSYKITYG